MDKTIESFKQWLESKESHVSRLDVLDFLSMFPDDEWVLGTRVICGRPGIPVVYIDYLLEKLDILAMPGGWKRVLDAESRVEFLRLQREAEAIDTPGPSG